MRIQQSKAVSQIALGAICLAIGSGCGGGDESDPGPGDPAGEQDPTDPPEGEEPKAGATEACSASSGTYCFSSRFAEGENSVSYSGQIARHVLVAELSDFIGGLSDDVDNGATYGPGELVAALSLYFENPGDTLDGEPLRLELAGGAAILEQLHGDISSGKNLVDKLAGNDPATDHLVWNDPGVFRGWADASIGSSGVVAMTPQALVEAFFVELENNAIDRANGLDRVGPDGVRLPVHLTESGLDLQQLVQKFLLGAIMFSQGVDDYLSDDVDGKGLLSSTERDEDAPFSHVEHAWDEAFGYFGAARDYDAYTDDEIAAKGGREAFMNSWHDTNGDSMVTLRAEVNFGASVNAAKRDRGAAVPTDFTADAFGAFLEGRRILAEASGALSGSDMQALIVERDRAANAWEGAIAATVVHYINETIADLDAALDPAGEYSFADQSKHWSEMKGFALAFQFNPASPVETDDFVRLHELLQDAPVVPDAIPATNAGALEAYRADLLEARQLLADAYAFDPSNVEAW